MLNGTYVKSCDFSESFMRWHVNGIQGQVTSLQKVPLESLRNPEEFPVLAKVIVPEF